MGQQIRNYPQETSPSPLDAVVMSKVTTGATEFALLEDVIKIPVTDEEVFYSKDFILPTTAPAQATTQAETPTNKVNRTFNNFDDAAEENIQIEWWTPSNWDANATPIKAELIWGNASGLTTEVVEWGIKAVAIRNDDPFETAFGAETLVPDVWSAQLDQQTTPLSGNIAMGGTPAASCLVILNIARKIGGADTLTGDARLIAVRILYTNLTIPHV